MLTGFALVTMTVIFSWLVYGRYVLNATPTWVEQASLLLIVFIGFLGAAVGIHKKTHLGVTFFRDKAPAPIKIILDMINHILIMIFGFFMMIYSYELVLFKWGTHNKTFSLCLSYIHYNIVIITSQVQNSFFLKKVFALSMRFSIF